jgi:regulator of sigma E protease
MTILATVIVLGVLIFVHELGHFMAAKLVGVEVQRFSIGLGPRVWGFKGGETEYVISAVPLGGYVKMGGMDDEIMEKIEGGPPPKPRVPGPRDFDGKPLWARTFVISAGVIMNMFFAFFVYTLVAGLWGVTDSATTRVGQVLEPLLPPGSEALAAIPIGASVVRVGEREIESWPDVRRGLLRASPGPLTVAFENPAGQLRIDVPEDDDDRRRLASALRAWLDPVFGSLEPASPAEKGGIEVGDRIVSVDGVDVQGWWGFQEEIRARPGARVELVLIRDGRELTRVVNLDSREEVAPETGEQVVVGKIGAYPAMEDLTYTRVGLAGAVSVGYRQTLGVTGMILGFLRDLITGNVSPRSVGSIVTIGEFSGQAAAQGLDFFLSFMALFSVNLAILNLLPIPVLDGGHLLFLTIEAIRGRALSVEQRMRWSQVGFIVLLGIMVWALSNDFMRLFGL